MVGALRTSSRSRRPTTQAPAPPKPRVSPRQSRRTVHQNGLASTNGLDDEQDDDDVSVDVMDGPSPRRQRRLAASPTKEQPPPQPVNKIVIPSLTTSSSSSSVDLTTQQKKKSIKLIVEPREDLPLLPAGYEKDHRFGGRLQDGQADINLTVPQVRDRRRFQAAQNEAPDSSTVSVALLHPQKKKKTSSPEIKCLHLGISSALAPWYSAPFPAEYFTKDGQLWMCEWCLKYVRTQRSMKRHVRKCCGHQVGGLAELEEGKVGVQPELA